MLAGELIAPFKASIWLSVAADALVPDTSSPSPRTLAKNAKMRNGTSDGVRSSGQ